MAVLDASGISVELNATLKEGFYQPNSAIRAVSVIPKKSVVSVILHLNATGCANLTLEFANNSTSVTVINCTYNKISHLQSKVCSTLFVLQFQLSVGFNSTKTTDSMEKPESKLKASFPIVKENMK